MPYIVVTSTTFVIANKYSKIVNTPRQFQVLALTFSHLKMKRFDSSNQFKMQTTDFNATRKILLPKSSKIKFYRRFNAAINLFRVYYNYKVPNFA